MDHTVWLRVISRQWFVDTSWIESVRALNGMNCTWKGCSHNWDWSGSHPSLSDYFELENWTHAHTDSVSTKDVPLIGDENHPYLKTDHNGLMEFDSNCSNIDNGVNVFTCETHKCYVTFGQQYGGEKCATSFRLTPSVERMQTKSEVWLRFIFKVIMGNCSIQQDIASCPLQW